MRLTVAIGKRSGAGHTALGLDRERAAAPLRCCFTDLANPVSNVIYPRLGFRPLQDAVEIEFGARSDG